MKKLVEIEDMLFMSKSQIKRIIKNIGIVPVKRGSQRQVYYDLEQIELIKENNPLQYIKENEFIILESKMNYE